MTPPCFHSWLLTLIIKSGYNIFIAYIFKDFWLFFTSHVLSVSGMLYCSLFYMSMSVSLKICIVCNNHLPPMSCFQWPVFLLHYWSTCVRLGERRVSPLFSKWQFLMDSKLQLLLAWECFGSSYLYGKVSTYIKIGEFISICRKYLQTSLGPNCNLPGTLFRSLTNIQICSGRIWQSKTLIKLWLQQKWNFTGSIWTILFGGRETFKSDSCHFCAWILCQVKCFVC